MKWLLSGMAIGLCLYFAIGLEGATLVCIPVLIVARCWQWIEWRWRRLVRRLKIQRRRV